MNRPVIRKIQRAPDAGLAQWPKGIVLTAVEDEGTPLSRTEVIRPLPRRAVTHSFGEITLPRARRVFFKAGIVRTSARLFVWLWRAVQFYSGSWTDIITQRDSIQRRAVRLRRIFERNGPSFAKLGQQLSLRADLLPYAYCAELGKMLDRVEPMPSEAAIAIIERNLKQPLEAVFEAFDPEPIGSASLACVYHAHLRTGERVAVKVRRPGIGPLIAADLRALDWLLILAETLTILAPGMTRRFRQEFQSILFRELNFRAEARYADLFRRRMAKRKEGITAPKVYFKYCTEEVMVSEFVSGVWMWEIMAAIDANDQEFLLKLRQQGIDPKSLARKLILTWNREVQEELFFHADPHPANIVIGPDNAICFVDFGAIGRFSTQLRKTLQQVHHHLTTEDVGRMVNASLGLAGAIPPVDIESVRWELEKVYADWLYAGKSKDAEWWERSTAQVWLRYMEIAQEFGLPVSFETIQYFRATFSYDAMILRLDKNIDMGNEWKIYARDAAKAARSRLQAGFRRRMLSGPTDMDYLQLEQIGDMATQFFFQWQRHVEYPIIHFRNIVGKISYVAALLLRLGYLLVGAIGLALIADTVSSRVFNYQINWAAVINKVTSFGWLQFVILVAVIVIIRRIVIRLNLPDKRLESERQ
jgi:ubiquinone biosynthesis protein